jgi:hypothetical protein
MYLNNSLNLLLKKLREATSMPRLLSSLEKAGVGAISHW